MKLVRNRIPQIIIESGKTPRCHIADMSEFKRRLEDKMSEELQEFREEPSVEEAADIYEVLRCLCWLHNISMDSVIEAAAAKRSKRGSFTEGIVLETVAEDIDEDWIEDDWSTTAQGEVVGERVQK